MPNLELNTEKKKEKKEKKATDESSELGDTIDKVGKKEKNSRTDKKDKKEKDKKEKKDKDKDKKEKKDKDKDKKEKKDKKSKTKNHEIINEEENNMEENGDIEKENTENVGSEEESKKRSKKRKLEFKDEIEVDLSAPSPASKKETRLLKKAKKENPNITLEELRKQIANESMAAKEEPDKTNDKSLNGIWVGNLSFNSTKEEIINFFVKNSNGVINKDSITRINLPIFRAGKNKGKLKGFAYINLSEENLVQKAIELSEKPLDGRRLLIKAADNFEGRPEKKTEEKTSKNPESRILFVGNLPFETTDDELREHFAGAGEIIKIRMCTFEDTGKCKGFGFVDFKDVNGAKYAMNNETFRFLRDRKLRLEYGEDRSQRVVGRKDFENNGQALGFRNDNDNDNDNKENGSDFKKSQNYSNKEERYKSFNRPRNSAIAHNNQPRMKTGIADFKGQKKVFGD